MKEGRELKVGDMIVIDRARVDDNRREGEVLEVLEAEGHGRNYRVRWDDGHESVYYPAPEAHVHGSD